MSTNEAKLHLSLKDGIFEISGSEEFVSKQIENFKEIILEGLSKSQLHHDQTPKIDTHAEAKKHEHHKDKSSIAGFDASSFPNVLHIEGTDVRIIKKMPGKTTSKKAVNTALAYLWGNKIIGIDNVPFKDIRNLCKEQGCLDDANFAVHMQSAKSYFIVEGAKGSSSKTVKLTLPGREKAEDLLKELNGK